MIQILEQEAVDALRLYIFTNYGTKSNFAKAIGISVSFVSIITTSNLQNRKPIPDNILKLIGVKRQVMYFKDSK